MLSSGTTYVRIQGAGRGNSRQGCPGAPGVARADRDSQVSAFGVGLPSGAPFRCKHRIKHRKRAPGQRGLRVGANLLGRNLDGNQIAWKLVMDEPTNDLDIETLELLESLLVD